MLSSLTVLPRLLRTTAASPTANSAHSILLSVRNTHLVLPSIPSRGYTNVVSAPQSPTARTTRDANDMSVLHSHYDYKAFAADKIAGKRKDGSYRHFSNINRISTRFPMARTSGGKEVTIWCSNDYLGMGSSKEVIDAIKEALDAYGAGAGGSRDIGGTGIHHLALESELANLHKKPAALIFSSGYAAQQAPLETLGALLPGCVIFSDALNHSSMIHGIRGARCRKFIFAHNDLLDLEAKLASVPRETPKIIAIESIYSMCGTVAPLEAVCDLAEKYGAITFVDEVHAIGNYGENGAGLAEHLDWTERSNMRRSIMDRIDIISGTFGKSLGVMGGYIAGQKDMVDVVRSFASGFLFTTSAPPAIVAGVRAALAYQRDHIGDRIRFQLSTIAVKSALADIGIPVIPNPTHIIPVLIGDPVLSRKASEMLLQKHGIYVQTVDYPTVAKGEERLRICSSAKHNSSQERQLVSALEDVWAQLQLKYVSDWAAEGGRAGVGLADSSSLDRIWSEAQLRLGDGNPPRTRPLAYESASSRFMVQEKTVL